MAGLPEHVLKIAAKKAAGFREAMSHAEYTRKGIFGNSSNGSTPAKELEETLYGLQQESDKENE